MADAGDYRNHRLRDGARDRFFVESPEIFERASAAREDQYIDGLLPIEKLKCADNFESRAVALHANRKQCQVHVVEATAQDADDVANRGTGRRRDQTDAARQHRQWFLAIGREEALGFETFFQLVEGKLQRAETDGLDALHINLIVAAGFVDADGAAHGDVQSVLGAEFHGADLRFETDSAELRDLIFQDEINVTGLRFVAVGDFAFDEDVGEVAREEIADASGEFGNRVDAPLGHQVELELAHGACSVVRVPSSVLPSRMRTIEAGSMTFAARWRKSLGDLDPPPGVFCVRM